MGAHGGRGLALVFPGQGSQRQGMALPWRDEASFARWGQADRILGRDVTRLGREASADELREPAACQVALFVHGVVLLEAWQARGGREPVAVAGHSLGEYVALVAAGVLGFADGLSLVHARATATQRAAEARPGTMVACLGYDVDVVAAACGEAGAYLANDNAPGQVVVAGGPRALARLREALSGGPGRGKVVDLDVGAAYHSPHMEPAAEPFSQALDGAVFADARVPVVANVDALPHAGAGEWPALLRRQLVRPVRWRETVGALRDLGAGTVVELGASAVLTGLVKRTDRSLARGVVTSPADLAHRADQPVEG
ncbi:MAG: ACP S-malonyltransferase [Actinobacteria bacterium]|nr:ACP S-malonyltransferase [Actinomycetota bacterium]